MAKNVDGFSTVFSPKCQAWGGGNLKGGCPPLIEGRKMENTSFQLVLRSTCGLSSPGKQVSRSSTQVLLLPTCQVCGRESEL